MIIETSKSYRYTGSKLVSCLDLKITINDTVVEEGLLFENLENLKSQALLLIDEINLLLDHENAKTTDSDLDTGSDVEAIDSDKQVQRTHSYEQEEGIVYFVLRVEEEDLENIPYWILSQNNQTMGASGSCQEGIDPPDKAICCICRDKYGLDSRKYLMVSLGV